MQRFELVLFCAIAVHIIVITSESGIQEEALDHWARKLAAQAVDVLILTFYLCALPGSRPVYELQLARLNVLVQGWQV